MPPTAQPDRATLRARCLVVLGSLFIGKVHVLWTAGRFAPEPIWLKALFTGHDLALGAVLIGAMWASRRGGGVVRWVAHVLVVGTLVANGVLTGFVSQFRAYPSLSDPHPGLDQVGTLVAKYGNPTSLTLIALSVACYALAPRIARVRWLGRPWPVRALGAALLVYVSAGALAVRGGPPGVVPVRLSPVVHYFASALMPVRLMDPHAAAPVALPDASAPLLAAIGDRRWGWEEGAAPELARPGGVNVILVLLESVGANAMQLGDGGPNHPFLDSARGRALVGARHYSPAPHSASALVSLFCSSYHMPGHLRMSPDDLLARCTPLASVLGAEGIQTSFFQSAEFGDWIDRPFFERLGFGRLSDFGSVLAARRASGVPVESLGGRLMEHETVTELLGWTKARCNSREPFFATWYSWVAHSPYPAAHAGGFPFDPSLSSRERHRRLVRVLDAQIERIDAAVSGWQCGRPTVVIVTSDHGEAFDEHLGNAYHAAYIYEENIHVPLIFLGAEIEGRVLDLVTSHVDLAPTILELTLGQEPAADSRWQGHSLLRPRGPRPDVSVSLMGDGLASLRFGPFKLIRGVGRTWLFDTDEDPGELRDLAAERPGLAGQMGQALEAWAAWQWQRDAQ